jgi:hypothetical protein
MRYLKRGAAADVREKADRKVREIVEAALADIEAGGGRRGCPRTVGPVRRLGP